MFFMAPTLTCHGPPSTRQDGTPRQLYPGLPGTQQALTSASVSVGILSCHLYVIRNAEAGEDGEEGTGAGRGGGRGTGKDREGRKAGGTVSQCDENTLPGAQAVPACPVVSGLYVMRLTHPHGPH